MMDKPELHLTYSDDPGQVVGKIVFSGGEQAGKTEYQHNYHMAQFDNFLDDVNYLAEYVLREHDLGRADDSDVERAKGVLGRVNILRKRIRGEGE